MDFETYRPLALRTAKMFPTKRADLRHAAMGLITEIGEFATEVKRIFIYGKPMTEEMRRHMIEELGDTQWYVPLALLAEGLVDFDYEQTRLALGTVVNDLDDIAFRLSELSGRVSAAAVHDQREHIHAHLISIVALIEIAAVLLGTTGDQMRIENIAKLRARFPDKYTDEAAEARADKGGLPAAVS